MSIEPMMDTVDPFYETIEEETSQNESQVKPQVEHTKGDIEEFCLLVDYGPMLNRKWP